jgi:hypothetical protein
METKLKSQLLTKVLTHGSNKGNQMHVLPVSLDTPLPAHGHVTALTHTYMYTHTA